MACRIFHGIVICGPRPRPNSPCQFCKTKPHTKLCDFPLAKIRYPRKSKSKTCDKKLCDDCATPAGDNLDYCPLHKKMPVSGEMTLF